jgi:hypothetical protein
VVVEGGRVVHGSGQGFVVGTAYHSENLLLKAILRRHWLGGAGEMQGIRTGDLHLLALRRTYYKPLFKDNYQKVQILSEKFFLKTS